MKIVRYEDHDGAKLGAVKGEGVVDLGRRCPSLSDNAAELIKQWRDLSAEVQTVVARARPMSPWQRSGCSRRWRGPAR